MKFLTFAIAVLSLFNSPVSAESLPKGKIVWSFVTTKEYHGYRNLLFNASESFVFSFRSKDGKHNDYASYNRGGILGPGSDFGDDAERGAVRVLTVDPGEWELFFFQLPGMARFFRKEFSIPFTVKPDQTIYIGSYRSIWIYEKSLLGFTVPVDAFFEVSDKQERDIAIAKKKDAAVKEVEIGIPDVDSLSLSNFGTVVPEKFLVAPSN